MWAQGATTVVALPAPLLPQSVQGVARTGDAVGGEDPAQADATAGDMLREDGLQRFSRAQYGGSQVEALQFHDATGAYSAFTFYLKGGARSLKPGDRNAQQVAVVGDRTVFLVQTVVLIGEKGSDLNTLSNLAAVMPKIGGPRSLAPLLPTFFPRKGLVQDSLRYAQGPIGYKAMGGTLNVDQMGWEKSAEAATADYADRRGKETLTILLYPTPQIAGEHARALETQMGKGAKVRREGELVIAATGSFSADDTQNMVENIHLHNEVSFDQPMPLEFHAEVQKTYSLLVSIAILSGFGMLAAVLLGLFFGGGRAIVRKLQGKDAATEAEFLSLHLDNQNQSARFDPPAS